MLRVLAGSSVVLLGLTATPATADTLATPGPVSVTEFVTSINAACRVSRDALRDGGGSVSGPAAVVVAPGRFERILDGRTLVVDEATGTYGSLTEGGLGTRMLAVAQRYLDRPRATHWLKRRSFPAASASGWTQLFDEARSGALQMNDDCAAELVGSQQTASRNGNAWTVGTTSVTLDDTGRLVEWAAPAFVRTFSYGARSVGLPSATVSYQRWTKTSQAASLNATLRMTTRQVARSVNASVVSAEAVEQGLKAVADAGRAVPLHLRQLRKGSLLYARNPFTNTYYAWRVYLKNGTAVARRVAP